MRPKLQTLICLVGMLAGLLVLGCDPESRLNRAQDALNANPSDPEAHFALGKIFLERSDLPAAEDHFQSASSLAPDHAEARLFLASTRVRLKKFESAIRLLESMPEPRDPDATFTLACAYLGSGQTDRAVEHFKAALREKPEWTEVFVQSMENAPEPLNAEQRQTVDALAVQYEERFYRNVMEQALRDFWRASKQDLRWEIRDQIREDRILRMH